MRLRAQGRGALGRGLGASLLVLGSACAAIPPSHRDERFLIQNHGGFTPDEVDRVRAQLDVGTRALEKYVGSPPVGRFPIVVNLLPGRGVSHSHGGQGAIELYWVREVQAPIIHELTQVLAGYTASNGHWTQEGFASYMQDRYGEDLAFPTRRMADDLVKVLNEDGHLLPMLDVMKDRNRRKYFGLGTPWERWLAYTQATSLCGYLLGQYGPEKFFELYDRPFEAIDFRRLYGRTAELLVRDWLSYVAGQPGDTTRARAVFHQMKALLGRR